MHTVLNQGLDPSGVSLLLFRACIRFQIAKATHTTWVIPSEYFPSVWHLWMRSHKQSLPSVLLPTAYGRLAFWPCGLPWSSWWGMRLFGLTVHNLAASLGTYSLTLWLRWATAKHQQSDLTNRAIGDCRQSFVGHMHYVFFRDQPRHLFAFNPFMLQGVDHIFA